MAAKMEKRKKQEKQVKQKMNPYERMTYQIFAAALWNVQCYCKDTQRNLEDLQGLDDVIAMVNHRHPIVPFSWLPPEDE